jgi:biotin operon repressor
VSAIDDWNSLKESTKQAVAQLLDQLQSESSTQDLLDSYLYAKKLLAESMQAFIRVGLSESNEKFSDLREQIQAVIDRRYAGRLPDRFLRVPYGSRVHEELFAILLQRQGSPVQAALLRVVTGDSVHTERRVRELRELGLDIQSSKVSGYDYYTLASLSVDTSFVPVIVANLIKGDKRLPAAEMQGLLDQVDYMTK